MMKPTLMRRLTAAFLATTALVGGADQAFAQIEEIVVTTRKRAESLQDVPITITAFTSEVLERKGIGDLKDLAKYSTGLILDEVFSKQDTRVVVRGLSPTRGRQNVAFLMDDVDISSEALNSAGGSFFINPRLFDVQRVEIVKGPHSALFGRSAFNGAIHYITKKPGDEFAGSVALEYGSHQKAEGRFSLSGPVIADKLSLGVNGAFWDDGGFYDNAVTGGSTGGGNGFGGAFSGVWTPTDILKATFRSEYSDDNFDILSRIAILPTARLPIPTAAIGTVLTGPNALPFFTFAGSPGKASQYPLGPNSSRNPRTGTDYPGSDRQMFRNTLRLDVEFNAVNLSAISHYSGIRSFQFTDALYNGDTSSTAVNALQESQFSTKIALLSEELRLQSTGEGPLQWTVGALYWHEDVEQLNNSLVCLGPSGGCTAIVAPIGVSKGYFTPAQEWLRDTNHYSAYALAEYEITEQLSVSAEIRRTWEEEDISGPSTIGNIVGCLSPIRAPNPDGTVRCNPPLTQNNLTVVYSPALRLPVSTETNFWTPRGGITYKATDDILIFASVAKGEKPGGTSSVGQGLLAATGRIDDLQYAPEKMTVYELGIKTNWLDQRVQVNASAYFQDFTAKQVSSNVIITTGPNAGLLGTKIENAGKAEVKGIDIETAFAVSEQLTLSGSMTFLNAEYKDYISFSRVASDIARGGNCTVTTQGSFVGCNVDYSGKALEGAAKRSLQMGFRYKGEFGAGVEWFVESDVQHQSRRFADNFNLIPLLGFWNADVRAGFEAANWSITGYVTNVFDDDKIRTGVALPNFNIAFIGGPALPTGFTAQLPDKRQFGLRTKYTF